MMSQSTPIKRKINNRNIINSSDSEDDLVISKYKNGKNIKRSDTFRKKIEEQKILSDDEDTGIFCLVQFVSEPERFDVLPEKQIIIDQNDNSLGKVKHYSSYYVVKIVKKGTEEYVTRMSKKFSYNLSLNTCDEAETDRQLRILQTKSTYNVNCRSNAAISLMDRNLETYQIEPTCSNQFPRTNESSHEKENFLDLFKLNEAKLKAQQEKLEEIQKKLDSLANAPKEKKDFVYNGVDLIKDVDGYPAHIWAKNCLNVLFNPDETKNHVLVETKNTCRPPCDQTRVNLLKDALAQKYNFPPENQDKVWKKIVSAFNTKGQSIKYTLKEARNSILDKIGMNSKN